MWNTLYKSALVILAVLSLVGVAIAYRKPLAERQNLLDRKNDIGEAVRQQQDKLDDLKQRQERLQTDPRFVEKLAREEFGYAKPGEVIFKVEGSTAARKN